jgi:hypothetical protein
MLFAFDNIRRSLATMIVIACDLETATFNLSLSNKKLIPLDDDSASEAHILKITMGAS